MSNRTVGKLGALPGQIPVGLKDLSYYVAGPLPTAPTEVAIPSIGSGVQWGMLGNDQYGDCGVAGFVHGSEAAEGATNEAVSLPSDQEVIDYYLQYTHGQDSGVVLSQFLTYIRSQPNGCLGHKVDSFAPIAVHNVPLLRSAVALFDFAYTGIVVTDTMQSDFQAGKPWTVESVVDGNVLGGHCVPVVGYNSKALAIVTWGEVQVIEWSAWHYLATEAWAVLAGDLVEANGDGRGVNLTALRADLDRL